MYYDSGIKEAVVKAEWIQKFDDNYWNGVTNFYQGQEDWFIENVATAMLSINQTKGETLLKLLSLTHRHASSEKHFVLHTRTFSHNYKQIMDLDACDDALRSLTLLTVSNQLKRDYI